MNLAESPPSTAQRQPRTGKLGQMALPENGTPSSIAINPVWSIHYLTSECLI